MVYEEAGKNRQKSKEGIEFRYYEMPSDSYLITLQGERWILNYGKDSLHFHNYMEIGYCFYGEGEIVLGKKSAGYRGKSFTVIPRNYPHCTRSKERNISRWEYLFVDVEGFLGQMYRERPVMAKRLAERLENLVYLGSADQNPEVADLIVRILEEMRTQGEFYKESIRGMLLTLLIELARMGKSSTQWSEGEQNSVRIAPILEYISKHYAEEIRVASLAEMSHVSETHFRRIFEKTMNIGPVEYVNMIRIQNACSMLRCSEESIETIREKVGFTTASTFNRNFKKIVRMSPGEWRRRRNITMADYQVSVFKGW